MRQIDQHRIQSFAFILSIVVAACFSCVALSSAGSDAQVGSGDMAKLDSRINPNDATVESLVRLPGLGLGRAGAIVAYRENVHRRDGRMAFENLQDLRKVRGIGPKTVQGLSEWITFDRGGSSYDG